MNDRSWAKAPENKIKNHGPGAEAPGKSSRVRKS